MRLRRVLQVIVLLAFVGMSFHEWAYAQQWPDVWGQGVCYTQKGWCPINGKLPIGASCFCTIPPNTPVYGTVTDLRYRGHVNPYFNPHAPGVPSVIR
jgi:hypothetical protein